MLAPSETKSQGVVNVKKKCVSLCKEKVFVCTAANLRCSVIKEWALNI